MPVILVVDDHAAIRGVTRRMLERLGHTVLEANDGADALYVVESAGRPPDLIISDINMPVVGGEVLIQKLKQRTGHQPRILLISGVDDEGLRDQSGLGRFLFLRKPFGMEELALAVERALA